MSLASIAQALLDKKRYARAGKETGQFVKTIFAAPAQSVYNTVRTPIALGAGALNYAANAAQGQGTDRAAYERAQQQVHRRSHHLVEVSGAGNFLS